MCHHSYLLCESLIRPPSTCGAGRDEGQEWCHNPWAQTEAHTRPLCRRAIMSAISSLWSATSGADKFDSSNMIRWWRSLQNVISLIEREKKMFNEIKEQRQRDRMLLTPNLISLQNRKLGMREQKKNFSLSTSFRSFDTHWIILYVKAHHLYSTWLHYQQLANSLRSLVG